MQVFVVVVNIGGLVESVDTRRTFPEAVESAVSEAAEHSKTDKEEIKATLLNGESFCADDTDLIIGIHACEMP